MWFDPAYADGVSQEQDLFLLIEGRLGAVGNHRVLT
jgi:hypothetical protein